MPTFTASPIVNAGFDPQDVQTNALNIQAQQQNLDDRATFRQNALGLLSRDPVATAAALGSAPAATNTYLQTIPVLDANTRAQSVSDVALGGAAAGAVLNAPPDQRAAVWQSARQAMINGGHTNVPGPDYPGDANMLAMRNTALSAQDQLNTQAQVPTTNPQSLLQGVPGGGAVGPGGQAGAAGVGITATPLPAPGGQDNGYQAALAQRESSGNPAAVNSAGYTGLYQFGTQRLASLGLYTPAPGETTNTNQWKGTLNIPGFPQVKTQADFKANPAAQNAAFQAHQGDIDQAIAATPGADKFSHDGLSAVAHLGGTAAMQQFVQTGGQYSPADSNGTSLAAYYKKFSGGAVPPLTPAPVRVASAANTAGMPQTANDASPGAPPVAATPSILAPAATPAPAPAKPTLPISIHSENPGAGQPVDDPGMMVSADTPGAAAGLPFGTKYKLPDGTVRTAGLTGVPPPQAQGARPGGYGANGDPAFTPPMGGQPTPPPAAASVTPLQATQQASTELAASLPGMDPAAANAAVQQRAQQIMAGGAPVAAPVASNPLAAAAPVQVAQQQPNALSAAGAPPQPQQQNPLATVGQPPAAPQVVQQQVSQPPVAGIPPGVKPLFVKGAYVPAAQPGYVLGLDAQGNRVAFREPGTAPTLKFTNVGGILVGNDPNTGALVSQQNLGNTGRLTQTPDGNGGTQLRDPRGAIVATTPSNTGHELGMQDYSADRTALAPVQEAAQQAQSAQIRTRDMRDAFAANTAGMGAPSKQALQDFVQSNLPAVAADFTSKITGMTDVAAAQEAAKLALVNAGNQERGTLGSHGSLGAIELYAKANPNISLQPQAIKAITNMQLIAQQADVDYAQAAAQHVETQRASLASGGSYTPKAAFDQQWQQQRPAQVYSAAMSALNGDPFEKWQKNLSVPETQRVVGILTRADPGAPIQWKGGATFHVPSGASGG